MTESIKITLPRLAGMRISAQDLLHGVPSNPGAIATVDASICLSASQGYCDEIVKQLFEVRQAASVVVMDVGEGLALGRYFLEAAEHRGFANRIAVHPAS